MSFTADHDAIRQFGHTITGLSDDAVRAVSYADDALSIDDRSSGMFATVMLTAERVREALTANYRHLARLADASGTEATKAADSYRDSDQTAASRLDATY